jgi:anti-anti-sigma factor
VVARLKFCGAAEQPAGDTSRLALHSVLGDLGRSRFRDRRWVVLREPGMAPLTVAVDIADGTAVVRLCGELDVLVKDALAEQLAEVAEKKPDVLVIDLAAVTLMDCGIIAVIIGTVRLLPSGRKPVLRSPCPSVRRLLELTGLDAQCELAA